MSRGIPEHEGHEKECGCWERVTGGWHLCEYHDGYADGYDGAEREYGVPVNETCATCGTRSLSSRLETAAREDWERAARNEKLRADNAERESAAVGLALQEIREALRRADTPADFCEAVASILKIEQTCITA